MDAVIDFFHSAQQDRDETDQLNGLRQQERQLRTDKQRTERIRRDLIAGTPAQPKDYFTTQDNDENDFNDFISTRMYNRRDEKRARDGAGPVQWPHRVEQDHRRKMAGLVGGGVARIDDKDQGKTWFKFTASALGRMSAAYSVQVRVDSTTGEWAVVDDWAVPVSRAVRNGAGLALSGHGEQSLVEWAKDLQALITAYWNRRVQFEQLKEVLKKEIGQMKADRDFTAIKFCLEILDGSGDDEASAATNDIMKIELRMRYAPLDVRPELGSLQVCVKDAVEPLSEEDNEELKNSCDVFYEKTLLKAIKEAF